jgi:hypothetical protein
MKRMAGAKRRAGMLIILANINDPKVPINVTRKAATKRAIIKEKVTSA